MNAIVDLKSELSGHPTEMIIPLSKLGVHKPPPTDPARLEDWWLDLGRKLQAYVFDCADEDFKVTGWRVER